MTLKEPHYLTEQGYKDLIILQTQYNKVVEQNRALQAELKDKTAECEKLKKAAFTLAEGLNFRQKMLDEIENFAKRHCNSCEDNGQQLCSSNYCYRHYLLDIIKKAKENKND